MEHGQMLHGLFKAYSRKVRNDQICVTASKGNTQMVEEKYALKGLYSGERLSTAGKKFLFSATGQSCLEGSPRKDMFP